MKQRTAGNRKIPGRVRPPKCQLQGVICPGKQEIAQLGDLGQGTELYWSQRVKQDDERASAYYRFLQDRLKNLSDFSQGERTEKGEVKRGRA